MIREYDPRDEQGWVRCRTLAFLETAYFDNVLPKKERYDFPAIELVAEQDGLIVGLIDVEYENEEGTVCSRGKGLGGMIWHIAVHPDYSRQGIGRQLLAAAEERAATLGLNRLEAWTRDDEWVRQWYRKQDFQLVDAYYHVYFEGVELSGRIRSEVPNLRVVSACAHYTGTEIEQFQAKHQRIHECVCFEKYLE